MFLPRMSLGATGAFGNHVQLVLEQPAQRLGAVHGQQQQLVLAQRSADGKDASVLSACGFAHESSFPACVSAD